MMAQMNAQRPFTRYPTTTRQSFQAYPQSQVQKNQGFDQSKPQNSRALNKTSKSNGNLQQSGIRTQQKQPGRVPQTSVDPNPLKAVLTSSDNITQFVSSLKLRLPEFYLLTKEDQRQILGNFVFRIVEQILGAKDPNVSRITGMLIDMDIEDLIEDLEDSQPLAARIQEGLELINQASQGQA